MENAFLNKVISNLNELNFKDSINGNFNDTEEIDKVDFKTKNKQMRDRINFVSRDNINLSGIESEDFINRLASAEYEELQNRFYISNNYRGFGYKKTVEEFESTMEHILTASIVVKSEENAKKEEIIADLQKNLMKSFKDKTLSNDEVMERVKKDLQLVEETFGINLSEKIAKNASILISKFRMSLYNLKEGSRECEHKVVLEKLQKKYLNSLTNKIKLLNEELPIENRVSLKDILMNLKGREKLDINFFEELAKKIDKNSLTLLNDIESDAFHTEKYSREISEINKYERLSSIALNYFLSEKNMLNTEQKKKKDSKTKTEDLVSSFKLKQDDLDINASLKKVSNNISNTKSMQNYIDRVYERINDNDKLNFGISKEEIEKSIMDCAEMFKEYYSDAKDKNPNALYSKLSNIVNQKIANSSVDDKKYLEVDILETVSNTLKDNLYNKIIEDRFKREEITLDTLKAYKIDVEGNLENGNYDFNKKKNEDLLSCDNMQKIFKMLSEKTLSNTEALTLLQNNRDILKTFSMEERYAVEDLVESVAKIKKEEIKNQKSNSPYKSYLFENLKANDEDYNPKVEVADFLKRKHIDSILNTGKNNKKTLTKEISNFLSNKYALMELYHCASKQVESRKMDTQLSMATQCMDSYKNRVEQELKETEKNISTIASNPALALSGFPVFISFLLILQKTRLRAENFAMIKNELDIAKAINHIESVNEQKIKDALAILYKLKNQEGKETLTISNVTDKETLIDVKKDIFYAELLMTGKEKINIYGKDIALDEISFVQNDALENFKAILNESKNNNLFSEITEELNEQKNMILSSKQMSYYFDKENEYIKHERAREEELISIQKEYKKAIESYTSACKNIPELKNHINDAKNVVDANLLKNIEDSDTQKKLREMLRNISKIQDTLKETKNDLQSTKDKLVILKRERESISPFVDILNENGKIDNEKLSEAIKTQPDKVITMFSNLNSLKGEDKSIKKMLLFNIIDRAANKNNSDLSTSDFFNEIISKVIPHSKNIIEDLTEFEFSSSMHPNDDKIILEVSNKKATTDISKDKDNENIFQNILEEFNIQKFNQ